MGMSPARPGPFHPARTPSQPPARPQVPSSSLGTASAEVGDLLGSVVSEKTRSPPGGREGFQFLGHEPRDSVNLA